jgi:DNA-binding NarL/FixJ family response regulator
MSDKSAVPGNKTGMTELALRARPHAWRAAIVIASDVVRAGVISLLNSHEEFLVVHNSSTLDEAALADAEARVVLVDVELPGTSPRQVLADVHRHAPAAGIVGVCRRPRSDIEALVEADGLAQAVSAWTSEAKLMEALRSAASSSSECNGRAPLVAVPSNILTPREREVLDLIAGAFPNKLIASVLGISEGTVKRHAHSLYKKLRASSRTHAILEARRRGYVA